MQKSVEETDKLIPPKRVRADRKTMLISEVHCPRALTDAGLSDDFFRRAYDVMCDVLGADCVCGAQIHKDEVHEYLKGGQTYISQEHMDIFSVPKTADKGINMKTYLTAERIQKAQDMMQEMVSKTYGISYQNGEGKSLDTVEMLKEKSKLEKDIIIKETAIKENTELLSLQGEAIEQNIQTLETVEEEYQGKQIELEHITTTIKEKENELEKIEDKIEDKKNFFDYLCGNLMSRFANAYITISKLMQNFMRDGEVDKVNEVSDKATPPIQNGLRTTTNIKKALEHDKEPKDADVNILKNSTNLLEEIIKDFTDTDWYDKFEDGDGFDYDV